jgi:hypothetical protein
MKKTLQKANKGGIEVNFETINQQTKLISNALQQLVFVIFTMAVRAGDILLKMPA